MFEDLPFETGRIKGSLERLKVEIEKEQIDRLKCRAILTEIQAAYEKMKYFILREWDSYLQKVPVGDPLSTFAAVWGPKLGHDNIESSLSLKVASITSAIYSIDSPQYYDTASVRRTLSELVIATESWLTVLDKEIFQSKALGAYSRLGELVGAKQPSRRCYNFSGMTGLPKFCH